MCAKALRIAAPEGATRLSASAVAALTLAGAILWAALPAPSFGAGQFDGNYRGTQRTLRSNGTAQCANLNHDNILLVVQDNHFDRHWGEADLAVDVGADGSFRQSKSVATVGAKGGGLRVIEITGKIAGGNLEADIGSDLCAAHLSLRKS